MLYRIRPKHFQAFWSRVNKEPNPKGCWLWIGPKLKPSPGDYGMFYIERKKILAHRASWEIAHGEPPPSHLCVCHTCDTPSCVNPDHLWIGTHGDNARDCSRKGRHFSHLHPELLPSGDTHWSRKEPHRVARGGRSGTAKLTEQQVREIAAHTESASKAAKRFGVSTTTILKIRYGYLWCHITGKKSKRKI